MSPVWGDPWPCTRVSIQGRKIVIYSAESTLLDPSLTGKTWQKSRNFKCRTKLSSQNFVTDVSVQEIPWMGHFARCKASSQMYKASGKIHIINCKRWWRLLMGERSSHETGLVRTFWVKIWIWHRCEKLRGSFKRWASCCVKQRWRNCMFLPMEGKHNTAFSPNFTKPGAHLLEYLCITELYIKAIITGQTYCCNFYGWPFLEALLEYNLPHLCLSRKNVPATKNYERLVCKI